MRDGGPFAARVALIAALNLVPLSLRAETAQEVQSWCRPFLNARMEPNGTFYALKSYDSGFCWGAFAVIQEIFGMTAPPGGSPRICLPSPSNRLQMIRVFISYVDNHPELSGLGFADVAPRSLEEAFPCTR
jgi:hypothetical protein